MISGLTCLRDFSWISFDNIIIIHQAFPKMSEENNRIYFSILKDAVNDFKRDKVHKLSVIFPSSEKDKIEHFLKNN